MENVSNLDYIWSRDQLRTFLSHPSKGVRIWAATRILDLYPDLKEEMIDFLPRAPQEVADYLLNDLLELDSNEGKVEPLLKFYQTADQEIDRMFRLAENSQLKL